MARGEERGSEAGREDLPSRAEENLADQSGSELDHQPRRTHAVALDVSPLRNKGLSLHFIAQLLTNYIRATIQITS